MITFDIHKEAGKARVTTDERSDRVWLRRVVKNLRELVWAHSPTNRVSKRIHLLAVAEASRPFSFVPWWWSAHV